MKDVKILTTQAIPGMIASKDVYTPDGHLIIAKDTNLNDKILTRLEFYSIPELTIYSQDDSDIRIETDFAVSTFYEQIKTSESFHRFQLAYLNTLNNFRTSIDSIVSSGTDVDTKQLLTDVNEIIGYCKSNTDLFHMLHCMREYNDTTYIHSLNVSLICNIIGKWLDFKPTDVEALTLCGLLHDLGKLMVPSHIITKPSKLTDEEFDIIKTHTIRGYNILKDKQIDPRIKYAVLMHHERCDGSGYPHGFVSDQIDSFAKLVSIADVYDAMTSSRVYRSPICPFEVIKAFEMESFQKFDPKYVIPFLEGIVQTFLNNTVQLNNHMKGEVILINKTELSRPVIRVGNQYIDLKIHRDLYVDSIT